ncbi:MAG: glycosyltransferase family 2 protein [Candidatus Nomurabacteria bacterium]|nr:MAG: glycosyltransferase family 2 protein [Candidatus Nomurabacteria bacterium]
MVELSIIIVNYKSRGLVKTCLRGIEQSHLRCSYEVIVVDNNSNDGTMEMLQERFPDVKGIQLNENRGLASGNNVGMRAAQGQFFLIINPDIAIFENMIEKMLDFMKKNPQIALLAPKLTNPDGTVQESMYRFPGMMIPLYRRTPLGNLPWAKKALRHYIMRDTEKTHTQPVDWVLGACMLVRRSAYEQIGEMDERYFLYFEDVDWCRRFWAAGYAVYYYPEAALVHYHRRLSAESPGLSGIFTAATRIHIHSGIRYFAKYFRQNTPSSHPIPGLTE